MHHYLGYFIVGGIVVAIIVMVIVMGQQDKTHNDNRDRAIKLIDAYRQADILDRFLDGRRTGGTTYGETFFYLNGVEEHLSVRVNRATKALEVVVPFLATEPFTKLNSYLKWDGEPFTIIYSEATEPSHVDRYL